MRIRKLTLALAIMALGFCGCKSSQKAAESKNSPLVGTQWQLESVSNQLVADDSFASQPYIIFNEDGTFGGFLRCHQKAVHRDEHGEGFPQGLEGGHQPLRNLWQHLDSIRRQGRDLPIQGQREVFGRINYIPHKKESRPIRSGFLIIYNIMYYLPWVWEPTRAIAQRKPI